MMPRPFTSYTTNPGKAKEFGHGGYIKITLDRTNTVFLYDKDMVKSTKRFIALRKIDELRFPLVQGSITR